MNMVSRSALVSAVAIAFAFCGAEANAKGGSIVCLPGIEECPWTSFTCEELAGYAPPGWLCRAAVTTSKVEIVKGPKGQPAIMEGGKLVPIQSDVMRRFLQNVKSYTSTKKPTKEELDRERTVLIKADDKKVSDTTLNEARRVLGAK